MVFIWHEAYAGLRLLFILLHVFIPWIISNTDTFLLGLQEPENSLVSQQNFGDILMFILAQVCCDISFVFLINEAYLKTRE